MPRMRLCYHSWSLTLRSVGPDLRFGRGCGIVFGHCYKSSANTAGKECGDGAAVPFERM